MTVSPQQSILNGFADLVGLGLPGTEANGGDFSASVEGVGFPMKCC